MTNVEVLPFYAYFGILLTPVLLHVVKQPPTTKLWLYVAVLLGQVILFCILKSPNCYEIGCPEIQNHHERQLYYEKYQSLNEDMNELRNQSYQYGKIFKALNHYLSVFLILLSVCHKQQYQKAQSYALYFVLIAFAYEVNILLTQEVAKLVLPQWTQFERIHLIRIVLLTVLLWIREICGLYYISNSDLIRQTLEKRIKKQDVDSEFIAQVSSIQHILEKTPIPSILSSDNTYNVILFAGLTMMIGN